MIDLFIDGVRIETEPGRTILEAADAAGIWIPRLCRLEGLTPWGGCRLCTVRANGRMVAACIQPAATGMIVENDTEELLAHRRSILELLFARGNHFCPTCEASGRCELQALLYRLGVPAPTHPYSFPEREVDASHPDVWLDRNRCVLCARCVRASRELDGKNVFGMAGRGEERRIVANAAEGLKGTDISADDRAVAACPVGALQPKRRAFRVPIGLRPFDLAPIDAAVAARAKEES